MQMLKLFIYSTLLLLIGDVGKTSRLCCVPYYRKQETIFSTLLISWLLHPKTAKVSLNCGNNLLRWCKAKHSLYSRGRLLTDWFSNTSNLPYMKCSSNWAGLMMQAPAWPRLLSSCCHGNRLYAVLNISLELRLDCQVSFCWCFCCSCSSCCRGDMPSDGGVNSEPQIDCNLNVNKLPVLSSISEQPV